MAREKVRVRRTPQEVSTMMRRTRRDLSPCWKQPRPRNETELRVTQSIIVTPERERERQRVRGRERQREPERGREREGGRGYQEAQSPELSTNAPRKTPGSRR